ncbi:UMP kinase [Desulfomonile tiedjei]|uniref:Uridylate kinase n=1 Tax=Desulfomonile tiedjei (strain ATCC 49306 / DSM 6799 / DCB-1) TaxID=706587 RepID=I4CAM5_DESTA|nr:UMP kinase [Desulfomonile tiedjei]AFM26616.1 uridylate kinase [Desulfomonile tiedjei DSM 6799]
MKRSEGYRRALLKISGEAMSGERDYGFDKDGISRIARQIEIARNAGHELGIVIGGGNILRGREAASVGVPPLAADHMGMIATVLNGLALRWALEELSVKSRVMCAFPVGHFVEEADSEQAKDYLSKGFVVIFSGGTGNPCFTTDSAAALRAVEIDADVVIKATQVNGVYDKDPHVYPDAELYEYVTVEEALEKRLGIMDAAAIEILGRKRIPTIVLSLHENGNIQRALAGEKVGTLMVSA